VNPTVLIATTARWLPTARLTIALANTGFCVYAVCPSNHSIGKTNLVRRIFRYRGLSGLGSFSDAISASKPDLIIPGDDLAAQHLRSIYLELLRKSSAAAPFCKLIERSLGAPESFPILFERAKFIEFASKAGIRVPKTRVIQDVRDLQQWTSQNGLPVVLKADGSSGGVGVRVAGSFKEAESALRSLQKPPLFARAAKRTLIDRDPTLFLPSLLRQRSVVNAQTHVAGREATSTIACWKGEVLATLHFEVVHKTSSSGHATVLRLIENPEMSSAVKKLAQGLNLSGVHGFDFMLENHTGDAYLIEINPRSTQVGHLTLGLGRDIPAALYAAVSGNEVRPATKVTEKDTIALFPQEWIRDPGSIYLQSAYHDVPWDQPELIRAFIGERRKQSAWYAQENRLQGFAAGRLNGNEKSVTNTHGAI